jgi:hypothetical protein
MKFFRGFEPAFTTDMLNMCYSADPAGGCLGSSKSVWYVLIDWITRQLVTPPICTLRAKLLKVE